MQGVHLGGSPRTGVTCDTEKAGQPVGVSSLAVLGRPEPGAAGAVTA